MMPSFDQIGIFTNTLIAGFALGMAILMVLPDRDPPEFEKWVWEIVRACLMAVFLCESARHGYLSYREVYNLPTPSQASIIPIVANIIMVFAYPPLIVVAAMLKWRIVVSLSKKDPRE